MAHFIEILINCPNEETAEKIGAACIEDKLAACANVLAPVASRYWWQGEIETAQEVPLTLKSRVEHFEAICAKVREMHPYEVPAITATDISFADQAYADWLRRETKEPA